MHLTLFVPDLLPAPGAEALPSDGAPAPALRQMFGRGELLRFPAIDGEAWLCQAFEVEQREDWPVAALTATLDGLDAENGWWLRADPAHLQLQGNRTRVLAAPALAVDAAEASRLVDALNRHFAGDGIELLAPQPTRWYLHGDEPHGLVAALPAALAGRAMPNPPFTGSRAGRWHRLLTEAQMLLHDHPVNRDREARSLPAINSLLLWGGGRKPAVPGRHFSAVWSDDALALALAVQSGAETRDAPASAALWLGQRPEADGRHLVVIDRAHFAARYEGPEAWLRALTALDERWFAPLLGTLGHRGLDHVEIVATGPGQCLRCALRPGDRLRFWRRAMPWPAFIASGS